MRILGLDFEATGLDTSSDRIIEIGAVLWDAIKKRPLATVSVFTWDESYPKLSQDIEKLTGITQEDLVEFGDPFKLNIQAIENICKKANVEYLVAHNAHGYDRPLLISELDRNGVDAPVLRSLPFIDTRLDIPFSEEPDSRKLKHLALDAGFINPFPHRAVYDVCTMLKVLSQYDIHEVITYSKVPWVVVRAMVDFQNKEKAKFRKYSWEKVGDKTFPKCWIKRMREHEFEKEKAEADFQVVRIE